MKDERPPFELGDAGEDHADEKELRSAAALARALEGGGDDPDLPQSELATAALLRLSAGGAELDPERRAAIRTELLAGLPARSERRRRSTLPDWARALPRWLFVALPLAGTAAVCLILLVKNPEPETSFSRSAAGERTLTADDTLANSARAPQAPGAAPALARREGVERQKDADAKTPGPAAELGAAAKRDGVARPAEDREAAKLEAAASAPAPADEARGIGTLGGGGAERREAMVQRRARTSDSADSAANLAPLANQPSARAALAGLDKEVRVERTQLLARANDAELSRTHTELDGAQSRAELRRSQASLTRLLETAGDGLGADDARQVRQDLYCRLAETALRLGEPRAALEWARRGIDLDGPPSPFLAQLMALEGDAYEALGEPSSAANSYMKALRVHEALLDESLDGH